MVSFVCLHLCVHVKYSQQHYHSNSIHSKKYRTMMMIFFLVTQKKKIDWHHIKRQSTRTLYERINKYEREKLPTILTLGNIWYIDQSINQSINQIKSNWKKYQTIKMSVSQSSKQIEGEKKNRIVYWQSLIFFFLSKKKFIYQTIDKWICFCFFLIEYVIDH